MSTVGNLAGVSSVSYIQPSSSPVQPIGGGDSDGDTYAGGAGQAGRASNLLQAIGQSLGQLGVNTTPLSAPASVTAAQPNETNPNQNAQGALQSFVKSLLVALHQSDGNDGVSVTDQDSDSDGSVPTPATGKGGRGLASKIQGLLQQISSGNQNAAQNTASGPLGDLNTSFQNLLGALNTSSGSQAQSAPTLQSFLQNLMQELGSGQDITGVAVNVKV
jgi:hypothetical protein